MCGGVSHFRFRVPDLSGARDLRCEAVIPCEEQADRPIELNRCVVVLLKIINQTLVPRLSIVSLREMMFARDDRV